MKKVTYLILLLVIMSSPTLSNSNSIWPDNKKIAVSLSYDDTLNSHLDVAALHLDQYQLNATFYISGARGELSERMAEWRALSKRGHELGNHTLYHPCKKSKLDRDWVQPHHDLDKYSVTQYVDELQVTNILLQAIDGKNNRTYAYTCGEMTAGEESVIDAIKPLVTAARAATKSALSDPLNTPLYKINAADGGGLTGEQLISLVKEGYQSNSLVSIYFHGVGNDYLVTQSDAHLALVRYLAENQDKIWVAPLVDIVDHMRHVKNQDNN